MRYVIKGGFMEEKKIKKISKKELLEILLAQAKRIEELEKELNKTKTKLDSKKITIAESGSIAEASLKLNSIFEVAQEAADQYLTNVKDKCKKIENDTKKECQIEKEKILKEAEELYKKRKEEADEYFAQTELKVKELTKKKEKVTSRNTDKNSAKKKTEENLKKENNKKLSTNNKRKSTKNTKTTVEEVLINKSKEVTKKSKKR